MRFLLCICILSIVLLPNFGGQTNAQQKDKPVKYTPEEMSKLIKFREVTASLTEKDYMKTDGYLMRWLRASELNVDAARTKLEKSMKWRAENNISTILEEELGQGSKSANSFYSITDAVDKYGRPVAQLEVRKMDARKYAVGGNIKLFARIWDQVYERLEDKIYKTGVATGKEVSQGFWISDLTDYNLRQHACLACIPVYLESTRSLELNYPGIFGRIMVLNAPRIFSPLLELLKPAMSSRTLKALYVFGPDKLEWESKLHEWISPDQLPVRLGGTKPKF